MKCSGSSAFADSADGPEFTSMLAIINSLT
jgi:hypothetical protein